MVMASLTAVSGCLSRSVRDIARYFDVTNGFDHRDPYSLPRVEGWEAGLGTLRDAAARQEGRDRDRPRAARPSTTRSRPSVEAPRGR